MTAGVESNYQLQYDVINEVSYTDGQIKWDGNNEISHSVTSELYVYPWYSWRGWCGWWVSTIVFCENKSVMIVFFGM